MPAPPLPPTSDNLVLGFEQELLTDWIPDAIGGQDAKLICRDLAVSAGPPDVPHDLAIDRIVLPLRNRSEVTPIVDCVSRATFHTTLELLLYEQDVRLDPAVCGYRDCASPYQVEFFRRIAMSRHLAQAGCSVGLLDIARFSESITLEMLTDLPWMRPNLLSLLVALGRAVGRYFLPGDHWGCRLGNAILSGLDSRVSAGLGLPWIRWLDDIHIFAPSEAGAWDGIGTIGRELAGVGFALNETKTRVLEGTDYLSLFAQKPAALDDISYEMAWTRGLEEGDRQKLRFAIRRMARQRNPAAISTCTEAVGRFPDLLPRVVHYLASLTNVAEIGSVLGSLASDANDFTTAWLLAGAISEPALEKYLSAELLRRGAESDAASIRSLAWRIQRRHGQPTAHVPPRMERWALRGGDDYGDLPVIDSNI